MTLELTRLLQLRLMQLLLPRKVVTRPTRNMGKRPPLLPTASFRSIQSIDEAAGLTNVNPGHFDRWAYFAYYLPILKWVPQYKKLYFVGDLLAGISLASFQIPLVMSLATSLAKLPPLVGLYSVVAAALMYSVFGGVPVLIVGPLPSTAVLYGQVVELIRHDPSGLFSSLSPVEVSAALSLGMSAVLLLSGLLRYGFVDSVLSRALLKGFIGAMGVIMIVGQLDIQMGLQKEALKFPHHSVVDKLRFAFLHWRSAHNKTLLVSAVTLTVVLAVRRCKADLVSKYNMKKAILIPELLAMVVCGTWLSYYFDWSLDGIAIIGKLAEPAPGTSGILINPLRMTFLKLMKKSFTTSFVCSLLGFFDSTTATKALGAKYNHKVSANRELVALGACNLAVAFVGGLPSFGALGRSKINILAGAISPLASIIMAITVLLAIMYFLPLVYYLPQCVLLLSTTIIGITVLEEVPPDILFFWRIGGYDEIMVLLVVFFTTLLWSVEAGVMTGITIAVLRIIRNSSKSQIHVVGRIPNTLAYRNADEAVEESFMVLSDSESSSVTDQQLPMEHFDGVLIIRIPEPLNFANFGDVRQRLSRLEKFGTLLVHPSQPQKKNNTDTAVKYIVFDCKGMVSIDACATQELYEAVHRYSTVDGICVAFARVSTREQVRNRLVSLGICELVHESVRQFRSLACYSSDSDQLSVAEGTTSLGDGFFLSIEDALQELRLLGFQT